MKRRQPNFFDSRRWNKPLDSGSRAPFRPSRDRSLEIYLFFFNDTATTEIYTLSLHHALPILPWRRCAEPSMRPARTATWAPTSTARSEEHTSELQSRSDLVCRLLLEKKK